MKKILLAFSAALLALGCTEQQKTLTKSGLDPEKFVAEADGKPTALYTLTNANGAEACITNFGGRLVSLMVPGSDGELRDVVLGHDSIAEYINIDGNFGALIGRYGNRIANGRFYIDSTEVQLPRNNFGHCLHGGPKGFHNSVWDARQESDSTLVLTLFSPDGEAGFPGNVNVEVKYTLTHDNAIELDYTATTDKTTILNLTNHSYFNLSGDPSHDILGETLWIDADAYTPIDSTFMTSGEIAPVASTPFDFTTPKKIGLEIGADDTQLHNGMGYDHNMVLREGRDAAMPAAIVCDSVSGIVMEVFTTEPGIQFYTGNFLDGTVTGKKGITYQPRAALCLETQHFPDSPNKPQWPSVTVKRGETYRSYCKYRFSTLQQ